MVGDEDHGALLDRDGDPVRGRVHAFLLRLHVLPALNERPDDRALDGARIRAGDTVADIGGGAGLRTQSVVERVGPDGDVLALEMSVDALEQLRANMSAPNVSYLIGRADVLPLMDASVDALIASSALIDVEKRAEAASEFLRVLRNGGRVSMLEWEQDPSWEQLFKGAGFSDVRTDPAAPYLTAVKP